jgi:hypothetical protein
MEKDAKTGRSQAMERFDRARKTTEEAMSIIDLERDATRKKTARLRKLRLEKEAEDGVAPIDKKPVAKKVAKKAAPKKKAK